MYLDPPSEVADDTPLTIGIRPEHFDVATTQEALAHIQVQCVEQLGADTLIHGQLGADPGNFSLRISGTHHFVAEESMWPVLETSRC